MALRKNLWQTVLYREFDGCLVYPRRLYITKVNLKKLRPMIHQRIEKRANEYPVRAMVLVALEVLKARNVLIQGVSTLLKSFPVMACKFCPELFIGEKGHLIRTCHGYKHRAKNRCHEWVAGGLNDILVPVETYHLNNMFQGVIEHNQRFDFDRIPAVVELCWQAGADPYSDIASGSFRGSELLSPNDLTLVANRTLTAWETLRSGVQKLLFVYPAKVCKYCSEVHVGPSGHKARLCGVFKYESWRGAHFWTKAEVDDLIPPKIVWRRRPQDPPVLVDERKGYYGRVPAILDLCVKAGAVVPAKYNSMMKAQGLSGPAFS
ncbi:APO protein 4, mitochondrial-like [Prosopis cineraria]|uniref:APO protein 4, mitochondrial-like n=1 Tax=Prosopis cineraria TaxID=364024 RepID=UPI00240F5B6A|nr:APO protein 4, mitochondrial-like [Prosopis cineraria]XP_054818957.1 APO protein 4, mitochondrial-like [Prosopis cineraria]XP_054818958.1 APO protein 4, mitochondrial-like [Prosopis cineraria]XP_054818959.1 APO protein 4, mitochondrial-like [Prosopis cineraria]XP_054818960.1 APO protein 4, mitochondrial-like [Prosopis cineraria]XP_054818961.1 APO protein 4, mitochondrial-like [Prosopis cineraria]